MRVLALNPFAGIGGAELSLLDILEGLTKRKHEVLLAAPPDGPLFAAAINRGVQVCEWKFPRGLTRAGQYSSPTRILLAAVTSARCWFSLLGTTRRFKPDVIYSNGIKSHFLSVCASPVSRVPIVWHVRDFIDGRGLTSVLPKAAKGSHIQIICNSHAVAREWGRVHVPISVVHNGFKASSVLMNAREPPGPCVELIAAGILAPWKGFDNILRACALLPTSIQWRLTICGDELYETDGHRGEKERLEDLSHKLNICFQVRFTGMVSDLCSYFRKSHMLLHGSVRPEPFGRVVAEAMLAGLPVIVPNAGGIPEFVRDGVDGLHYPIGDVGAMSSAIQRLVSDEGLRVSMRRAGRNRIARDFPLDKTVSRVESLLSAASSHRRR